MENNVYEIYQVAYTTNGGDLRVENFENLQHAMTVYNEHDGFMLMGIDSPTCFKVIYARPIGMKLVG